LQGKPSPYSGSAAHVKEGGREGRVDELKRKGREAWLGIQEGLPASKGAWAEAFLPCLAWLKHYKSNWRRWLLVRAVMPCMMPCLACTCMHGLLLLLMLMMMLMMCTRLRGGVSSWEEHCASLVLQHI